MILAGADERATPFGSGRGFRLHKNFIFRLEYFGGLLLSRSEGTRYVLGVGDSSFVWALECGLSVEDASDLVRSVHPDYSTGTVLATLFSKSVLVQRNVTETLRPELFELMRGARDRANSRDYLSAPLNLSFYPFMACQMRCTFCYVTAEKWQGGHARPESWLELAREASGMGVPTISLLGGDPSLYPGIVELIEGLDAVGITGVITTNGCNVSEDLLDAMVESDSLIVSASLQSVDGDYHGRMTGRSVDETLDFIRRVRAAGKKFTINSVYIQQSDEQVRNLIDFAIAQDATKLSFGVFVDIAQTGMKPPSFADYRRIYELGMDHVAHRRSDLVFQVEGCQLYTAYPDVAIDPIATEFERLVYGCEAGNGRLEIMHDGSALPCALFEKSTWTAGNAFTDGLETLWNGSSVMTRIRSYKNKDKSCSGCKFGGFCNGGCPALNESRYGSIEAVADDRCAIRRPDGVPEVDYVSQRATRPRLKTPVTIGRRPTP